jgi:hypothetical protein
MAIAAAVKGCARSVVKAAATHGDNTGGAVAASERRCIRNPRNAADSAGLRKETIASRVHAAVGRIVSLLLLCFIVGVVLAFFGTTPTTLFGDLWGMLIAAWGTVVDLFAWAMPYIALGAMVVVPIAVVSWLLRLARRRS